MFTVLWPCSPAQEILCLHFFSLQQGAKNYSKMKLISALLVVASFAGTEGFASFGIQKQSFTGSAFGVPVQHGICSSTVPLSMSAVAESPTSSYTSSDNCNIRNIAVIAHVDHGKTTLVDALIKQSAVFRDNQQADDAGVCLMDSEDQEKERGITILAKNLAVMRNGVKINIMDTPGHADFGGEVERVLNMCDGVLLVVDSVEGPKPQTRFVLDKALRKGMKALVVVNKIDRPAARPDYVVDKVFDLFVELDATDEQIDFTTVFASGILGKAGDHPDTLADDMGPLFDAIMKAIDPPVIESVESNDLQCLVSNIDYDNFKGKMGIARITKGSIKKGQAVALAHPDKAKKTGRIVSFSRLSFLFLKVLVRSSNCGTLPFRF
jgi:GTP-binding protein